MNVTRTYCKRKMDTTITPDTYTPGINDKGAYVDDIPVIRHGIYCSCGSRDKMYPNRASFTAHTKTKHHQQWLETLNRNKANHYVESLRYKELAESQQKILVGLENQLVVKSTQLESLEKQVATLKVQLVSFISNIQVD
jgi:hypothetical protein